MNNKLNKTTYVNMNENQFKPNTISYKLKEINTGSITEDINKFKNINKSTNVTTEIYKIKKRCYFCKKKLKMIHYDCKCDHKFCERHRLMQTHQCEYIKQNSIEKRKLIEKNNPKIGFNKVNSI